MDLDVTSLLEAALQQGIWAALYIYLFFRMLKENASREERYQNMGTATGRTRLRPSAVRRLPTTPSATR